MSITSPITTNHHQSPTNHLQHMGPITFQSLQRLIVFGHDMIRKISKNSFLIALSKALMAAKKRLQRPTPEVARAKRPRLCINKATGKSMSDWSIYNIMHSM